MRSRGRASPPPDPLPGALRAETISQDTNEVQFARSAPERGSGGGLALPREKHQYRERTHPVFILGNFMLSIP